MATNIHGETFGGWLLSQKGREGLSGQMVAAAEADPKFPRDGDPEDVRQHLHRMQDEGDSSMRWTMSRRTN